MISKQIRKGIENSPTIMKVIGLNGAADNWNSFTRTTFERIARSINQEVTKKVLDAPFLVEDFLLFGQHEFENILFKHKLSGMADFVAHLKHMNHQKPYHWISGKTLQAYWNGGNAKDKKLNVLLTFLDKELEEWDEWKNGQTKATSLPLEESRNLNDTLRLLRKHFTGCYYRYYQKTDNTAILIKAPFLIREDPESLIVVETKTPGHRYESAAMVIRNGALYLDCENMDWDEKESFIFNIGFETHPEVITGVSNTLNKKGQAIAIKNVLVKATTPYDYASADTIEIPFKDAAPGSEAATLISFFENSSNNIIITPYFSTLDELLCHQ